MPQVVWSPRARRQLEEILDYLAEESAEQATTASGAIVRTVERVGRWPRSGPWVGAVFPQLEPLSADFRVVVSRPYLVFYYSEAADVYILSVQHGAKRLPTPNALARARRRAH
jgi:plasmid stabilization system protein ParE